MVMVQLDGMPVPEEALMVMAHPDVEHVFNVPPTLERIRAAIQSEEVAICLVKVEGVPVGFIITRWLNPVCVSLAGGFVKDFRGKFAKKVTSQLIEQLFAKAGVIKIVGEVVSTNKASRVMAALLGFREEGLNRQSIIKDGQVLDQIYYGLTRSDWNGKQSLRQRPKSHQ